MKCEECKFCKYDNSIKEFVCSIEPDLPVVDRDAKNNCKKAIAIVKDSKKKGCIYNMGNWSQKVIPYTR